MQREGGPDLKEFKRAVLAQSEDKLFFRLGKEPNSPVVVQIKFGKNCFVLSEQPTHYSFYEGVAVRGLNGHTFFFQQGSTESHDIS